MFFTQIDIKGACGVYVQRRCFAADGWTYVEESKDN